MTLSGLSSGVLEQSQETTSSTINTIATAKTAVMPYLFQMLRSSHKLIRLSVKQNWDVNAQIHRSSSARAKRGQRPQSRSLRSQLADRRFFARALSVLGVHLLQFGTWIASWVLLALLISNPVSNANFLWLWILALASTAVLQAVEVALQEDVALRLGAAIKRALFSHSLRTRSDAVAETGLGAMISRMLEANTFDKLATNGALQSVLAQRLRG